MKPHRITFKLSSPVMVPGRPVHLDALAGFAAFRGAMRGMADEASGAEKDRAILAAIEDLPFEKATGADGEWCWKASQLHFTPAGPIQWAFSVRRYEPLRWGLDRARGFWAGKKDSFPVGTGQWRAFRFIDPIQQMTEAKAWFVGDPVAVEAMMKSEITELGRSRRAGWGRVREIVIEEAPASEAEFWRRRTLPKSLEGFRVDGHFMGTGTVRNPYWERAARREVYEFDARASVPAPAA